MNRRVLCVDDDPKLLSGLVRQFGDDFELHTKAGGEEAVLALQSEQPFAVIISDMRMPVINGVQFLARAREITPDSVRMMLTGNADMQCAMDAVNEGSIFRFLTKPCDPAVFTTAVEAGIELYRLRTAERELLRDTLTGAVRALTGLLAKAHPAAFGRATRIRTYARHIANHLQLEDPWQYELAAMLSLVGCVSLPPRIIDRLQTPDLLSREDRLLAARIPEESAALLANIPRLNVIAEMVRRQQQPSGQGSDTSSSPRDPATIGAHILKAAADLEGLLAQNVSFTNAWRRLRAAEGEYNPEVLDAMLGLEEAAQTPAIFPAESQA